MSKLLRYQKEVVKVEMEDGRVIHVTAQEEQRQSPSTQDCPRGKGGSGGSGEGAMGNGF